jgi:hypothetical protein
MPLTIWSGLSSVSLDAVNFILFIFLKDGRIYWRVAIPCTVTSFYFIINPLTTTGHVRRRWIHTSSTCG